MDLEYEERVLSILRGREGWDEDYISVSEFTKHYLDDGDDDEGGGGILAAVRLAWGWVLWWKNERQQQQQQRIVALLRTLVFGDSFMSHYLLQFWEVEKVEEGPSWHHHLSSSHLPFCVGDRLSKGVCCYRKLCKGQVYVVNMELGVDDQEQQLIGGIGRVYRNQRPESTPDLRLYSSNEFPMRDEAARCGFRGYLALPLIDVHTDQCFGVLELLCRDPEMIEDLLSTLKKEIEVAGFRSTHGPLALCHFEGNRKHETESEIRDILILAMATVPRLYLAQVWVPCKQFANNNLCCMEIESSIDYKHKRVNCWKNEDYYDEDHDDDDDDDDCCFDFLQACKFHNLPVDHSNFPSNLCDLNISKNPLAHYAQRARMPHSFAITLQSMEQKNHLYVVQFYLLQPKFRQDSCGGDDSVPLLLRIMEKNLKTIMLVSDNSRQSSAVEWELVNTLEEMKSYNQHFSKPHFMTFLETLGSRRLLPSSDYNNVQGWNFCRRGGETLSENVINSILIPTPVKQKVEVFMNKIAVQARRSHRWIVQFWAPGMEEGRCYLETWSQPYAVGCLSKGIASFRKKCMTHYYFVDDVAKQEELGPPGRAFRNRHPEITPELLCYTTNEFPIRNCAVHCFSREYIVLPIFDDEQHKHKCVGVLEFLGFQYPDLVYIRTELEEAKLCSTHIDFHPRFLSNNQVLANEQAAGTINCRKKALIELHKGLLLKCINIPQLHMANVWVPDGECLTITGNNMSCMELALSTNYDLTIMPVYQVHWIHVQNRKGIVGMALASESKSCFCRNLYEFSIADQPLLHFEMKERRDACFAICLQSSHTADLVYVLEFFLYQGPATYEYVRSFLNFLLPMMKHELKSFKLASGKQLGEELVVEVIEFSEANNLHSSGSVEADVFPIKFKSVQYNAKEHPHSEEEQAEEEEECRVVPCGSKRRERGKGKARIHLTVEVLQPLFQMTQEDAAEVLGVGKSTVKRACRRLGIPRWPGGDKHRTKPFGREDMRPSASNSQPLDASLHQNVAHTPQVIVKVRYGEEIVKFELCLSLGLTKLIGEVASRLNLETSSLRLKYLDEDGDEIVLTRDDELQLCPKSQTPTGKTCIRLLLLS